MNASMEPRKRSRLGRIITALAGAAPVFAWTLFSPGPLPRPARLILSRPYWRLPAAKGNTRENILADHPWAETYLWLNEREILAFDSTAPLSTRAERIDAISGIATVL